MLFCRGPGEDIHFKGMMGQAALQWHRGMIWVLVVPAMLPS